MKDKKGIGILFIVTALILITGASIMLINDKEPSKKEDVETPPVKEIALDEAETNGKLSKEKMIYKIDDEKKYDSPNSTFSTERAVYDSNEHKIIFKNITVDGPIGKYDCTVEEKGNNYCYLAYEFSTTDMYNLEEGISTGNMATSIIDNRYVFVKDSTIYDGEGKSHSQKNPIILYDLLEKKELERYTAIKDNSDYVNSILIVKDTNHKWGLVNISNGEVKNLVEFEYDYIGTVNGLFMLVKDNWYYTFDSQNNQKVGPFNNQISNMNGFYIVTNEGEYRSGTENNYRLYTATGEKVLVESGNNYIKIVEKLALVVNSNNKLCVYQSDGTKLIEDELDLYTATYHSREGENFVAFNASTENNILTINTINSNSEEIIYKYDINTGHKIN